MSLRLLARKKLDDSSSRTQFPFLCKIFAKALVVPGVRLQAFFGACAIRSDTWKPSRLAVTNRLIPSPGLPGLRALVLWVTGASYFDSGEHETASASLCCDHGVLTQSA
jgi:hypothetical protein